MLRYLIRYETARLLFSGPGLVLAAIVALALATPLAWAADHWVLVLVAALAFRALSGRRRRR